jgi:hypothetical protein
VLHESSWTMQAYQSIITVLSWRAKLNGAARSEGRISGFGKTKNNATAEQKTSEDVGCVPRVVDGHSQSQSLLQRLHYRV